MLWREAELEAAGKCAPSLLGFFTASVAIGLCTGTGSLAPLGRLGTHRQITQLPEHVRLRALLQPVSDGSRCWSPARLRPAQGNTRRAAVRPRSRGGARAAPSCRGPGQSPEDAAGLKPSPGAGVSGRSDVPSVGRPGSSLVGGVSVFGESYASCWCCRPAMRRHSPGQIQPTANCPCQSVCLSCA